MNVARIKVIDEKEKFLQQSKDKINGLEKNLKIEKEAHDILKEEQTKLDKLFKANQLEKEKMRQRLIKMKRTRNVDINQKICKKCQKEYV